MKRTFTILLASMLLVFSLTACGRSNNAQTSDDPPTTNQGSDTTGQSQNTQTPGGQDHNTAPGDAIMGGDAQNGGQGSQNGMSNQNGDTMTDQPAGEGTDSSVGVSYEQMLRNGRVHDTDGLLQDGENSVSSIAGDVKNAAQDVVRSTRNAVNGMTR